MKGFLETSGWDLWKIRKNLERSNKQTIIQTEEKTSNDGYQFKIKLPANGFRDENQRDRFKEEVEESIVDFIYTMKIRKSNALVARRKLIGLFRDTNKQAIEVIGEEVLSIETIDKIFSDCGLIDTVPNISFEKKENKYVID